MNLKLLLGGLLAAAGLSHYLGWFIFTVLGGRTIIQAMPYVNILLTATTTAVLAVGILEVVLSGRIIVEGSRGDIGTTYLVIVPMAVIGIIVGALTGSPMLYLISDTVYLTILVVGYLASRHLFLTRPASEWNALQGYIRRVTAIIAVVAIVFVLIGRTPPSLFTSLIIATLTVEVATSPRWRYATLLAISLLVQLPLMNRATLLQIVFAVAVLIYIRRDRLATTLVRLGVLGLIVMIALAFIDLENSRFLWRMTELISFLSGEDRPAQQIAILQRFYEADRVIDEVRGSSLWHAFLGFGSGATVDMSSSMDNSVKGSAILGASRVHNIHFLPIALYYRHGIMGLIVLGMFISRVGRSMYHSIRSTATLSAQPHFAILAMTFFLSIINGMFASSHFLTNFTLPVFAALLDAARVRSPQSVAVVGESYAGSASAS